ncbi:MAG: PhoX family phosphatase [Deltaproteobacteria bacterium]|nr:PhoX family phosphatase [Deltaproteobacteria bacterium]
MPIADYQSLMSPQVETGFGKLAPKAISRRGFLSRSAAFTASAFVMSTGVLKPFAALANPGRFAFEAVAANTLDTVTVPRGYSWHAVARWGDPMWSRGPAFDQQTRGTGASQELAFGDNNDGMALFNHRGRNILAVNNEYVNLGIVFAGGRKTPRNADDVRKSKAAHGVSVVEITRKDRAWSIVKDSPYNRRITADTPMEITGPARGHELLRTAADPAGARSLGTWNNCGNGRTPWGTYLSCEENFHEYFSTTDASVKISPELERYGVNAAGKYGWAMTDERFDIARHPNEPNRAGYVVEIDPLDPESTPKKRTALGRFKHENAEVVLAANGQAVVYMGDDERGEFLYKFVSDGRHVEGGDNADLLENGRLYVARFADRGRGEWLELTPESTGMASMAEVCIHTRIAASAVKATTMDRPEWVAANPRKAEVYCALTNNKDRGKKPNAGGDPTPVGGPNPRAGNLYGQIVRWRPDGGDHLATGFDWDLYVVAGNPAVYDDANAGSGNVDKDNMFNSPDGIAFDRNGMLWIQTDGDYSNAKGFAGQGNNQMLVGDPVTGEIRRFLVGPRQCEVTGIAWSADGRTLFVGIQHPGEKGDSHFPDGGDTVPRSAVIAVTRDDGGPIG